MNNIMKNKKIIAISVGVAALASIFAALYAFTPFGAEIVENRGFQYQPWNTTRSTIHAESIVIGVVKSVETRIVDESFTSTNTYTGEPLYNEVKTPYQFVTIDVERYILNRADTDATQLTFRDFGSGVTTLDGKKVLIQTEDQTEYKIRERALFFVEDVDGNLQSQGVLNKFNINDDGTAQSAYLERTGTPPKDLTQFEAEIREIVQRE